VRRGDLLWTGGSVALMLLMILGLWHSHAAHDSLRVAHGARLSALTADRDATLVESQAVSRLLLAQPDLERVTVFDPASWQAQVRHAVARLGLPRIQMEIDTAAADVVTAPNGLPWVWHSVPWALDASVQHGPGALQLLKALDHALGGLQILRCALHRSGQDIALSCEGSVLSVERTG